MFARFGGTPTVRADAGVHEKWRSRRAEDHWRRRGRCRARSAASIRLSARRSQAKPACRD